MVFLGVQNSQHCISILLFTYIIASVILWRHYIERHFCSSTVNQTDIFIIQMILYLHFLLSNGVCIHTKNELQIWFIEETWQIYQCSDFLIHFCVCHNFAIRYQDNWNELFRHSNLLIVHNKNNTQPISLSISAKFPFLSLPMREWQRSDHRSLWWIDCHIAGLDKILTLL